MMQDNISVRQWQEMFQAGIFHQDGIYIPKQAGWDDFYDPLNNKGLQNLSKLVMRITHPFILDNYHVYFMHHTPGVGPMFGCVYFNLLSDEQSKKSFLIALDNPYDRKKWTLETMRYGGNGPEYDCGDIRSMSRYINNMAHELEQDIQPSFIAEKQVAATYAILFGEPLGIRIYREGEHRYSYTSFLDKRVYNVMVISDPKDAPPGFDAQQAEDVRGMLVYCPENAGKEIPDYLENIKRYRKMREAER